MDVLEEIYNYRNNAGFLTRVIDKKEEEKESSITDYLIKTLSGEGKELFLTYIEIVAQSEKESVKKAYIQGVKDGAKITLGLTK